MEITYMIGDQKTAEDIGQQAAMLPFHETIVSFLDQVSKYLLKDRRARQYPDLVTFSFWCRRASVMEMKRQLSWLSQAEEKGVLGRGVVFHIAPSNVAMNVAYSFAAGFLAGNAQIVRLPSKEFPQITLLCEAVRESIEIFPEFKKKICFVRYGHQKEITDFFSQLSDVRVIWGGDRTIQEIRKSPLKIRGKEIVFADRYSIAVLSAEEYLLLEDEKKERLAKDFYNDTYLMDQNACTSPMLLVWIGEGTAVQKAKKTFWQHCGHYIKEHYELQAVQAVKKLQAAYRLAAAVPGCVLEREEELGGNVIVCVKLPYLNEKIMEYRENSGFFMEYETEKISSILPVCTERCQTISYFGEVLGHTLRAWVKDCCPAGVDRMVPIGKTMDFSLIWDGYDLIREMSREIG